jgi:hypothetical protein
VDAAPGFCFSWKAPNANYFSAQNQHRLSRRENLPEDGKLQSHANLRLTPTALADSFF